MRKQSSFEVRAWPRSLRPKLWTLNGGRGEEMDGVSVETTFGFRVNRFERPMKMSPFLRISIFNPCRSRRSAWLVFAVATFPLYRVDIGWIEQARSPSTSRCFEESRKRRHFSALASPLKQLSCQHGGGKIFQERLMALPFPVACRGRHCPWRVRDAGVRTGHGYMRSLFPGPIPARPS